MNHQKFNPIIFINPNSILPKSDIKNLLEFYGFFLFLMLISFTFLFSFIFSIKIFCSSSFLHFFLDLTLIMAFSNVHSLGVWIGRFRWWNEWTIIWLQLWFFWFNFLFINDFFCSLSLIVFPEIKKTSFLQILIIFFFIKF